MVSNLEQDYTNLTERVIACKQAGNNYIVPEFATLLQHVLPDAIKRIDTLIKMYGAAIEPGRDVRGYTLSFEIKNAITVNLPHPGHSFTVSRRKYIIPFAWIGLSDSEIHSILQEEKNAPINKPLG